MRKSEFGKITALGRAEFALEDLQKKAAELHRKAVLAKAMEEIAALNVDAAEPLLREKSAMQFTPAIRPLISGWSPIQNKKRPASTDRPVRAPLL